MKRLICLVLAAVLLWGCSASPSAGSDQTSDPAQSTPATSGETTEPQESSVPAETAPPPQSTVPEETTLPPESVPTASEKTDGSYTVKITDPEQAIYDVPSFLGKWVAMFEEAGTYTIVQEYTDADGNLWGKLKSGIGWTCLTNPVKTPIRAAYAPEGFQPTEVYRTIETDFVTELAFTTNQNLRNIQFTLLSWTEDDYTVDSVLHEFDTMTPETPFLAAVVFWGDMTTYGISFVDANEQIRRYALVISGKDGSLLCIEY